MKKQIGELCELKKITDYIVMKTLFIDRDYTTYIRELSEKVLLSQLELGYEDDSVVCLVIDKNEYWDYFTMSNGELHPVYQCTYTVIFQIKDRECYLVLYVMYEKGYDEEYFDEEGTWEKGEHISNISEYLISTKDFTRIKETLSEGENIYDHGLEAGYRRHVINI